MSVAITRWASAPSRLARASTESAISFSARPPISETLRASSCRSTSKALAVCSDIMANLAFPPVGFSPLPEAAGDVVLRAPVSRRGEYLAGGVEFDQLAEIHKGREVGNPRRLLHVVGDDHDRIVFLQLVDQLFDLARPNRSATGAHRAGCRRRCFRKSSSGTVWASGTPCRCARAAG